MQVASAGGFLFYRFMKANVSETTPTIKPATARSVLRSSTLLIASPPLLYAVAEETTRRPYLPTPKGYHRDGEKASRPSTCGSYILTLCMAETRISPEIDIAGYLEYNFYEKIRPQTCRYDKSSIES